MPGLRRRTLQQYTTINCLCKKFSAVGDVNNDLEYYCYMQSKARTRTAKSVRM